MVTVSLHIDVNISTSRIQILPHLIKSKYFDLSKSRSVAKNDQRRVSPDVTDNLPFISRLGEEREGLAKSE